MSPDTKLENKSLFIIITKKSEGNFNFLIIHSIINIINNDVYSI